jgi:hypothetical protein
MSKKSQSSINRQSSISNIVAQPTQASCNSYRVASQVQQSRVAQQVPQSRLTKISSPSSPNLMIITCSSRTSYLQPSPQSPSHIGNNAYIYQKNYMTKYGLVPPR